MMSYDEFGKKLQERYKSCPEERAGQVHFNVLYKIDPKLADQIRTTELDPFYHSERIPVFLAEVGKHWGW